MFALVVAASLGATFLPRERPHFIDLFALWSAAYYLVYVAWEHHYVMLLPALVLLVVFRPQYRVVALACFVLLTLPTPYYLMHRDAAGTGASWPDWADVLQHATKPLPALAFWALLTFPPIAAAWRSRAPVRAPVGGGAHDRAAAE
jgi:hypothetical protein